MQPLEVHHPFSRLIPGVQMSIRFSLLGHTLLVQLLQITLRAILDSEFSFWLLSHYTQPHCVFVNFTLRWSLSLLWMILRESWRECTWPLGFFSFGISFSSVFMPGCESWTVQKAERRRIDAFPDGGKLMVFHKTLESPLDCKKVQPVHSEGDQSWVFFGRTDAKAETPILWPHHAKSWLIGKDSDDGRDWGQEEKGTTGDEMTGWHHRLNGLESEWTPGVGDGQGGLVCCNSWGHKESRHYWGTELNWT